jgi:hypothetical protein
LNSRIKSASLALIPFVMFGLVFGIGYAGISIASSNSHFAHTIVLPHTLNYSTYQIIGKRAEIDFLYSFSANNRSGTVSTNINMTSIGFGPDFLKNGTYISCDQSLTDCSGISTPSVPEITYYPSSSMETAVNFKIEVAPNASLPSEYFLFFPPGAPCGYYLFLIFGNQIPSKLPTLIFNCPAIPYNSPHPSISVIGIQNITGLNIPIQSP